MGDFGGAMICSLHDTQEEHSKKVDSSKLVPYERKAVRLLTLYKLPHQTVMLPLTGNDSSGTVPQTAFRRETEDLVSL